LIKIYDKPFIIHQLELLKKNKFEDIIICVGKPYGEMIINFVNKNSLDLNIKFSFLGDYNSAGTGGRLKEGIKLYPHQIVAAMFMNVTRNTLISHEMGIGKSLSSILYVEMNGFEKVMVITPNSLKFNFYGEVEKFTESNSHIVNWKKNKCSIEDAKYIIVNYDFFNPGNKEKFITKWKKLGIDVIDCVICDESQKLKNTKANTYKNFKNIFRKEIFRNNKISKIFLSGTPAPNRAYELYTVLNQIAPTDFPTKKYFYEYYCGMIYDYNGGWGYISDSAEQKLEELYHKIAPYTHRKRKFEVLKDLPDKIYQRVILEMDENESVTYNKIEEGVANEFILHPNGNPLTIMLRLRQYTSHLKIKHVIELIENILETGEKVVIVDYFKESLIALKEQFGNIAGLHTGDQTVEERAEIVAQFQDPNSNMKIFLGSIQTCNYGLTLTAASKLFILTLPYSVGEYDQVSDRLHRIGQKFLVNIYPLIFPDTIDDYVFSLIEGKRKEIVKVIDNEDYKSNVTNSVLGEVIEKIKKKHGK
jgi:SNF2 family DNA or RNA helicase